MTIGFNIWMICLILNWFFYDPSRMLQFSEFVWALCSSVYVVFNNFLLIETKHRSKISSDQKRLFCAESLYPLSFFANTPFKSGAHRIRKQSIFKWKNKNFIFNIKFVMGTIVNRTYNSNYLEVDLKLRQQTL